MPGRRHRRHAAGLMLLRLGEGVVAALSSLSLDTLDRMVSGPVVPRFKNVRGTYGTPKAGTRTPCVQCVAPRGKLPSGTYSTQEASTRSPWYGTAVARRTCQHRSGRPSPVVSLACAAVMPSEFSARPPRISSGV